MHRSYNPNHPERKHPRLPDRDYSAASAYFVTICTHPREPVFENPVLHEIVQETWESLATRFPSITLDEFIIMADHVHFILWLHTTTTPTQQNAPKLGKVVGAFKSIVVVKWLHHIRDTHMECSGLIWQDGFYDRVVRMDELEQTRQYIYDNPIRRQKQNPENK